jgi:hypothetical protein
MTELHNYAHNLTNSEFRTLSVWHSARQQPKMTLDFRHTCGLAVSLGAMLIAPLAGCAYRLPAGSPRQEQRIKLVSPSPEQFTLRVRLSELRDYPVPPNGRVTLDIPAYRGGCTVYLFHKIRITRGPNPYTEKRVELLAGRNKVHRISIQQIAHLPLDPDGYHVLSVSSAH